MFTETLLHSLHNTENYTQLPQMAEAMHAQETKPQLLHAVARYALRPLAGLSAAAAIGSVLGFGIAVSGNREVRLDVESLMHTNKLNSEASAIASKISDRFIKVDCNDAALNADGTKIRDGIPTESAGHVIPFNVGFGSYAPPVVVLREAICKSITEYHPDNTAFHSGEGAYSKSVEQAVPYAESLLIMLHEIQHTNQVTSESAATCYAFQELPGALEKNGLSHSNAHIVTEYTAGDAPYHWLPSYLSPECHPNGKLDLGISDAYILPAGTYLGTTDDIATK